MEKTKKTTTCEADRKALAFQVPDQEESQSSSKQDDEEDENFFELTLDELKKMYHNMQKQKEIEDSLLTREKREEKLNKLRKPKFEYKCTVIRVHFPDRTVLQGTFEPTETVGDVKEFIRRHIKEPGAGFYLFTSPPKNVLKDESSLTDLNFVPTAKIYFGVQEDKPSKFLSDRIEFVPFGSAQEAANSVRRPVEPETSKEEDEPTSSQSSVKVNRDSKGSKKIPKWFKTK